MATSDPDPMPTFVIKAKDRLAIPAIRGYYNLCRSFGLDEQATEVGMALEEIYAWQGRHPERMQDPDHKHVPARPERP